MDCKKTLIATCLSITGLCLPLAGLAQDTSPTPTTRQPAMPMMGMQQHTMPMMQGQQGGMPMMQGQQGGMPMMQGQQGRMPMMPGYGRHRMHMPGQGQPRAGMHGCQHGGKHHMGGDGKGMRHEMMQAHHKNMEERLARIEALLQQLVEQQKQ